MTARMIPCSLVLFAWAIVARGEAPDGWRFFSVREEIAPSHRVVKDGAG